MGIPVSKIPKITPTRSRVRTSIPLTPMPTEAAKLDSPSETATSSSASMRQRYPAPRRALRRCAVITSLGTAPCRNERRDRASTNRSPESFINGFVFALKSLTLSW